MPATPIIKGDTWRYHPEHGAKLIYLHEVEEYEANGWVDTPDKFGIKEETDTKEDFSLPDLTRKELLSIAKDKGLVLGKNPRKADIIEAINGVDF